MNNSKGSYSPSGFSDPHNDDIEATATFLMDEVKVLDPSTKVMVTDERDLDGRSSSSSEDSGDLTRNAWGSKTEYVLSMVGYCVGLGNVWRFPYVCIRNGGGAFLIPFFVCLTLCGLPLYLLEVSLGQFVNLSPFHVWNICPLFKGIGIAMATVSFIFAWYYSMVLAWSLIYLVNSFRSPLPWSECGQDWNSDACVDTEGRRQGMGGAVVAVVENITSLMTGDNATATAATTTMYNVAQNATAAANVTSISSTEEFWIRNVLNLSSGFDDFGAPQWQPMVALVAQAIIVYLCLIKGTASMGKVVYVTATLPYILLTVFLIKGLTLSGAYDGIVFYLTPQWEKVFRIETWVEASLQVFYSLGPAWGALITMASYNRFDNNLLRDSVVLSFTCEGTSVFAGFAIFSILGHMAQRMNLPIEDFAKTGPGLAFVVYPEAISLLPLPQMWGVLFFVMLFTLGLDTQFASCETILTCVSDMWPRLMKRKSFLVKLTYFVTLFICAIPFTARGGMYLFQLVDWYFAAYTVIAIGFLELIVVAWIYGAENFYDDIQLMLGHRPPIIFAILWRFITPVLLLIVAVSTLITYEAPQYQGYTYSRTEVMGGWILATSSFLPIPIYFVYALLKTPGTLMERLRTTCRPNSQWQPSPHKLRAAYHERRQHKRMCIAPVLCCKSNPQDSY